MNQRERDREIRRQLVSTLESGHNHMSLAEATAWRPDRAVIRQFTRTEQIQIPVLFGTQTLGRAYGVGPQPAVLYLVSEEGRVMLRQAGRVNPRAALN